MNTKFSGFVFCFKKRKQLQNNAKLKQYWVIESAEIIIELSNLSLLTISLRRLSGTFDGMNGCRLVRNNRILYGSLKNLIPVEKWLFYTGGLFLFVEFFKKAKKKAQKRKNHFMCSFAVLQFFNEIKIEDARITELSMKTGQPMPFEILQECLKRFLSKRIFFPFKLWPGLILIVNTSTF